MRRLLELAALALPRRLHGSAMSVDLRELARRVGEAAKHNATEHAWRERTPEHCPGCRAEAAALEVLRELRELAALEADLFYARAVPFNAGFDTREIWQVDTAKRIAAAIRAIGEPPS